MPIRSAWIAGAGALLLPPLPESASSRVFSTGRTGDDVRKDLAGDELAGDELAGDELAGDTLAGDGFWMARGSHGSFGSVPVPARPMPATSGRTPFTPAGPAVTYTASTS